MQRLLLILTITLTGCATTPPPPTSSSSTPGSSPLITTSPKGRGTPVTVSGYVDTSTTTQFK